jgi:hypothetical protein
MIQMTPIAPMLQEGGMTDQRWIIQVRGMALRICTRKVVKRVDRRAVHSNDYHTGKQEWDNATPNQATPSRPEGGDGIASEASRDEQGELFLLLGMPPARSELAAPSLGG